MRIGPAFLLLVSVLAAGLFAGIGPAWALDTAALYLKIKGSVVSISQYRGTFDGWVFLGSGFVLGDGTLVATNNHVVESDIPLRVESFEGRRVRNVRLLRYSVADDLALLKMPEALPPLTLYPENIKIGLPVVVLGNPKGYRGTMARGIVSGLRSFPNWREKELIQTTVPVSPGSSGSPLMDEEGRVLGVISGGYPEAQNLNFAVPVAKLRKLLGDLLPGAETGRGMPPESTGGLDVRKAADGSITIIQERPKK